MDATHPLSLAFGPVLRMPSLPNDRQASGHAAHRGHGWSVAPIDHEGSGEGMETPVWRVNP